MSAAVAQLLVELEAAAEKLHASEGPTRHEALGEHRYAIEALRHQLALETCTRAPVPMHRIAIPGVSL